MAWSFMKVIRIFGLERRDHGARPVDVHGGVGIPVHAVLRNRLHTRRGERRADAGERHERGPEIRILRAERPRAAGVGADRAGADLGDDPALLPKFDRVVNLGDLAS